MKGYTKINGVKRMFDDIPRGYENGFADANFPSVEEYNKAVNAASEASALFDASIITGSTDAIHEADRLSNVVHKILAKYYDDSEYLDMNSDFDDTTWG